MITAADFTALLAEHAATETAFDALKARTHAVSSDPNGEVEFFS